MDAVNECESGKREGDEGVVDSRFVNVERRRMLFRILEYGVLLVDAIDGVPRPLRPYVGVTGDDMVGEATRFVN